MAIVVSEMPFQPKPQINSGVYAFINTRNSKAYIGSTRNIPARRTSHLWALRRNRHSNLHLQNAWNRDGESAFEFVVLECVPKEQLLSVEQWYLDACQSANNECGYNLSKITNGVTHSEDGRRRISEARKGKAQRPAGYKMTDEQKAKIGAANRGKKRPSMSAAHRAAISAAARGRKCPRTPEWTAKISAAKRGSVASPETRARMSESQRLRWALRKQGGGDK